MTADNIRKVKIEQSQCSANESAKFSHIQDIIFGDLSARPINDVAVLLDEIYYPILNNPANQEDWPEVIKKDLLLQIQEIRNVIAEVRIEGTYVRCRPILHGAR